MSIVGGGAEMAAHKALSNTKEGSKKNIEYHYDAGNALFLVFRQHVVVFVRGAFENADGTPAELNGDDTKLHR